MALWGGRFEEETDELLRQFGDSIGFDRRLYAADIRGSVVYATTLAQAGLITAEECSELVKGLDQVKAEFASGTFRIEQSDEDIHTAVERRLGELALSEAEGRHPKSRDPAEPRDFPACLGRSE
jgi:argininosuccinate lyase